jgi:predicted RNase H-like HicB family nuclease
MAWRGVASGEAHARAMAREAWELGMKTEQKYSELIVFVFYIINRFLT